MPSIGLVRVVADEWITDHPQTVATRLYLGCSYASAYSFVRRCGKIHACPLVITNLEPLSEFITNGPSTIERNMFENEIGGKRRNKVKEAEAFGYTVRN